MINQGARLRKVWVQKVHVSQKIVLYFKGVTVNTEDYSQRSRSLHLKDKRHKQFSTPHKEKHKKKKKRKEPCGKSHPFKGRQLFIKKPGRLGNSRDLHQFPTNLH